MRHVAEGLLFAKAAGAPVIALITEFWIFEDVGFEGCGNGDWLDGIFVDVHKLFLVDALWDGVDVEARALLQQDL